MIIEKIIDTLCRNKFEAYLAGGAVRDMLLGLEPSDTDVVTDARTEDIRRIFRGFKVVAAGKSFKVNFIDGIEVATYRNSVSSEKPVSLQTDLKRRDLTINSMALCPYSGDLTDPFGGLNDLKNKIIRFTQNPEARIKEDPCRIVRACRFLSKIDGVFDPDSLAAMRHYKRMVKGQVAPERIRLEIMKALEYAKPSIFFNALQSVGVLADILPTLNRCVGLDGGQYHDETVFTHCMMVGDSLSPQRKRLRLAGFLHDTGKAKTIRIHNGRVRFIGHEKATDRLMADLKMLRFTISELTYIQALINLHMRRIETDTSPKAVRRFLAACQERQIDYTDHLRMAIADRKGNLAKPDYTQTQLKMICKRIRTELSGAQPGAFGLTDLALTGRDVMRIMKISQGPAIGKMLGKLLTAVIDNPHLNTPEHLAALILNEKTLYTTKKSHRVLRFIQ
ncbi:CCA tRNA nucleotidyltransferase [Desulfococcaceae bacterium HSG9]|nr:CCA tRNA nucleotidyltransferase [Desulfococcaceae bacterium HSG9]